MFRPISATFVISCTLLATACSPADDGEWHEDTAVAQDEIINGSVDNSGQYEEVVAVFSNMGKCTGTIIHNAPPYAFVLTAAHCVNDHAPQLVLQGTNHDNPTAVYPVDGYDSHGGYNGSVNDFAMIRVIGAAAATPTRDVLRSFEDNIGAGRTVTHLGYGVINTATNPDTGTTQRHITTGTVSNTSSQTLTFDASSSGVCFGDSGGPNIDQATGKVAGVNSYVGGGSCATYSVSGRASAYWDSYILPFINNSPPPPTTCSGCSQATTVGLGACRDAMNTCQSESACNSLADCLEGCSDDACADQCVVWYSAGATLYEGVRACLCNNACTSECATHAVCTADLAPDTMSTSAAATSSAAAGGATGAGGATAATGTTGAGAANGSGFVAGDSEDADPSGTLLSSGCAFGHSREGGDPQDTVLFLAIGAIGAIARRRRRELSLRT